MLSIIKVSRLAFLGLVLLVWQFNTMLSLLTLCSLVFISFIPSLVLHLNLKVSKNIAIRHQH